jgi:ATP/maltotriose-dependent transcriptional regulator MalT
MPEQMASMEELIRTVVGNRSEGDKVCSPTENSRCEELLLDVEVDGARYLLVRLPKPLQHEVQLSPREHEIVRLIALGHSNKMIAGVLNISSWTVCTRLRRIFSKLGVGSRAAVVARIPEMGNLRFFAENADTSRACESRESNGATSTVPAPRSQRPDPDPLARARPHAAAVRTSR